MWGPMSRTARLLLQQDCLGIKSALCKSSAASASVSKQNIDVRPLEEMPTPGGIYRFPVIGNMFLFQPFSNYGPLNMHLLLDKLHEECGKTFRLRILGNDMVFTEDPSGIESVFRNEGKYPRRGPMEMYLHYAKKNNLKDNLATTNGKEWHKLRTRLQKILLRPSAPHSYLPVQNEVADDFTRYLATKQHTPEELRNEFYKFAAESISMVCFGKQLGCFSEDATNVRPEIVEFIQNTNIFIGGLNESSAIPLYKIYPTKTYKRFEQAGNAAYRFGSAFLEEALAEIKAKEKEGLLNSNKPNLLLSLLSQGTDVEEITSLTIDLLVAGTDSTAKSMEFFLRSLALNPDKQAKLCEEVNRVVGVDGEMTAKHIEMMPYYKACFKESMRINFPIVSGTNRILTADTSISGYHVPKGTFVLMNNNRALRNPDYFENPDLYIPERWQRDLDGKLKQPAPNFLLLPFGFGVRKCIGQRFAEQEVWLGVCKIVQKFNVSVSEDDKDHKIIFPAFRTTERPIQFKFTPH